MTAAVVGTSVGKGESGDDQSSLVISDTPRRGSESTAYEPWLFPPRVFLHIIDSLL
jgi:hypothetical protein